MIKLFSLKCLIDPLNQWLNKSNLLSTFPISQVVRLLLKRAWPFLHPKMLLCLNPVSAHTVCLAWYIVKEHSHSSQGVWSGMRILRYPWFRSRSFWIFFCDFHHNLWKVNRRHHSVTTAANYKDRDAARKIFFNKNGLTAEFLIRCWFINRACLFFLIRLLLFRCFCIAIIVSITNDMFELDVLHGTKSRDWPWNGIQKKDRKQN